MSEETLTRIGLKELERVFRESPLPIIRARAASALSLLTQDPQYVWEALNKETDLQAILELVQHISFLRIVPLKDPTDAEAILAARRLLSCGTKGEAMMAVNNLFEASVCCPEAVEGLIEALRHPDADVRAWAAKRIESGHKSRREAFFGYTKDGKRGADFLLEALLKEQDSTAQTQIAKTIGSYVRSLLFATQEDRAEANRIMEAIRGLLASVHASEKKALGADAAISAIKADPSCESYRDLVSLVSFVDPVFAIDCLSQAIRASVTGSQVTDGLLLLLNLLGRQKIERNLMPPVLDLLEWCYDWPEARAAVLDNCCVIIKQAPLALKIEGWRERIIRLLHRGIDDDDKRVRLSALSALFMLWSVFDSTDREFVAEEVYPRLQVIVENEVDIDCIRQIRNHLMYIVSETSEPNAISLLLTLAKRQDLPVSERTETIRELGQFIRPEVVVALTEMLRTTTEVAVAEELLRVIWRYYTAFGFVG